MEVASQLQVAKATIVEDNFTIGNLRRMNERSTIRAAALQAQNNAAQELIEDLQQVYLTLRRDLRSYL